MRYTTYYDLSGFDEPVATFIRQQIKIIAEGMYGLGGLSWNIGPLGNYLDIKFERDGDMQAFLLRLSDLGWRKFVSEADCEENGAECEKPTN